MVVYTRVRTRAQDALLAAALQERHTFAVVTSGARAAITRPGMRRPLEYVAPGDTVATLRQREVRVRAAVG